MPDSLPFDAAVPILQPAIDRGEIAGAVALATTRDGTVATVALGHADLTANTPMAEDTLFWVASQTKPMTAAALMMLVDEGRVALDDPLEKDLPEYAGIMVRAEESAAHRLLRRPAHPPTIREALSHRSGLPFGAPLESPVRDRLPLRLAVGMHAMLSLDAEPGTFYQYSNAGFSAAGRIVEVLAGTPYEDFLQARLFDPSGMADTTFRPTAAQVARLAKAYRPGTPPQETPVDQLSYPLTDSLRRFPYPGGGLFSTARDCARFCRMVLRGGELDGRRYLSAESVSEMTRVHTPAVPGRDYALGWSVDTRGRVGHGGALQSQMSLDPRTGTVAVLLVQAVGADGLERSLWPALQDAAAVASPGRGASESA